MTNGNHFGEGKHSRPCRRAANGEQGQVMKASKGKANPALVGEILQKKLA